MVKNPPITQETEVQSLGREGPLEKETAPHSSILAWETPWTEERGGLHSMGSHRVEHDITTKQQQSYDPAISLQGVDPKERKSVSQTNSLHVHCSMIHSRQEMETS